MPKIARCSATVINDSRGEPTIEATLVSEGGESVKASVPQGKSKGSYEAASLDAASAVHSITETIAPALLGYDPTDQEKIDRVMCDLDGAPAKSRLGGNAILAVSIAAARLGASARGIPLWRHLRNQVQVPTGAKFPRLFVNVINGGLHAKNNLDFQEYLVIPRAEGMAEAMDFSKRIYAETKAILEERGGGDAPVGDEGGFMPRFKSNEEPFEILTEALSRMEGKGAADFGLDAAASNVHMERDKLFSFYEGLIEKHHLMYLEDPFSEDDFDSFAEFNKRFGAKTYITGDDLTVTNIARMRRAHERGSVGGVIIKPNQVGTVTEAIAAVRQAREWGWYVVVSHRSGETMDDFIADFAYGVGADGFKLGAPMPPERMAKYNRLLAIEKETRNL